MCDVLLLKVVAFCMILVEGLEPEWANPKLEIVLKCPKMYIPTL